MASEVSIADVIVQARKIKYDVIGLAETRRHHSLITVFDTGGELFLGTCDSRGVGGVCVCNTTLSMNIDSFKQLNPNWTSTIETMWINTGLDNLRRLRSYIKLRQRRNRGFLYGLGEVLQKRASYKVIAGDFNAKVGHKRRVEELHIGTHGLQWNEHGERLPELITVTRELTVPKAALRWTPCGE